MDFGKFLVIYVGRVYKVLLNFFFFDVVYMDVRDSVFFVVELLNVVEQEILKGGIGFFYDEWKIKLYY